MEWFFGFINNQWTIGIGTGLVSGVGVNVLLKLILNRKDNKEFRQKIATANSEIIYSLRSAVAEESMPNKNVIESIARATARKHEVKRTSLISISEIADDLIKEVMDSNFLSQEQKDKYTNEILAATSESPAAMAKSERSAEEDVYFSLRKSLSSQYINYLSFIITLIVVALTLILSNEKTESFGELFGTTGGDTLPIIIGAILIPVVAALALMDNVLVRAINNILNAVATGVYIIVDSVGKTLAALFDSLFNPKNKR